MPTKKRCTEQKKKNALLESMNVRTITSAKLKENLKEKFEAVLFLRVRDGKTAFCRLKNGQEK